MSGPVTNPEPMTPEPNADPESEAEFNLPDLSQWSLVLPPVPLVQLSRKEMDARRAEMAPRVFDQLDFCKRQEQKILALLKNSAHSKRDRKYLISALESIRHCVGTELELITSWGLTRPQAKQTAPRNHPVSASIETGRARRLSTAPLAALRFAKLVRCEPGKHRVEIRNVPGGRNGDRLVAKDVRKSHPLSNDCFGSAWV